MYNGGGQTGAPTTAGTPAFGGTLVEVEETFEDTLDVRPSVTERF